MIKKKVILNLNNTEYEILRCNYSFKRQTDSKGRPNTGVRGGDIWIEMESNEECKILSQMVLKSVPPVEGYIELLEGEDEKCIRRIKFDKGYVCDYMEVLQTGSAAPMHTRFRISTIRMDIGDRVKLDRRWPETTGFHWHEFKEEEKKQAKNEPKEEEQEKTPVITKVYWKDAEGKEIMDLPDQGVATLCAVTQNTSEGDIVRFNVELSNGNSLNVSGTADSNGLVEITNINLGSEE